MPCQKELSNNFNGYINAKQMPVSDSTWICRRPDTSVGTASDIRRIGAIRQISPQPRRPKSPDQGERVMGQSRKQRHDRSVIDEKAERRFIEIPHVERIGQHQLRPEAHFGRAFDTPEDRHQHDKPKHELRTRLACESPRPLRMMVITTVHRVPRCTAMISSTQ